ncbi:DUF5819 family protein [Streptomyces roseiscleroticus]|uniref:DUF5819 family protein n=1 Tax=Streptomyces TaxID=1883 RepID=UPI0027E579F9|nr:DUF5819 family protein [Streptomyces ruber]
MPPVDGPAPGVPSSPADHPTPSTSPNTDVPAMDIPVIDVPASDAPSPRGTPPVGDASVAGNGGIARLSLPSQILAVFALAVVVVVACVHLGMVFLHVAPPNTITKQHGRAVDAWIYPEFEQNWKLFAPNPLQQNIAVEARAEVYTADGGVRTTGWYDLSALDGQAIEGNLLPSHTQQNQLRRALDFYVASHDEKNRSTGLRGDLSEQYLRRVVVMRLEREDAPGRGGTVERVQVRSRTTPVPPPEWSEEKVPDRPLIRELPWWTVTEDDRTGEGT